MKFSQRNAVYSGRSFHLAYALTLLSIPVFVATLPTAMAQSSSDAVLSTDNPVAAVSPVVPQHIRYSGKVPSRSGESVEAVFRIYAAAQGGEPLWTETQTVPVAEDGSYSVLLGVSSIAALPQSVFANGAARWLGISMEGEDEPVRVPLSSVPYAMEAADAQSLAGHRSADFATQQQLAQTREQLAQVEQLVQTFAQAASSTPPVRPALTSQPFTSGPVSGFGTAGTIPLWTDSATIGNSEIVQGTAGIGINQPVPAATLDVGGSENVNGILSLPPQAAATSKAGQRSQLIQLSDSAYSTKSNTPITSTFKILTNYVGSNTASPGGQLEIHYQPSPSAVSQNVLTIAGTGVITFAPTQKFPGTIASVTATSPVTATTTSGATSIALNESTLISDISPTIATAITPTLQNTFNADYAQLAAANTFTGGQVVQAGDGGVGLNAYGTLSPYTIGVFASTSSAVQSGSFGLLHIDDGFDAGAWADAPDNPNNANQSALIATADNSYAGIFFNNSANIPTITVLNNHAGGPTGNSTGIATVMRVGGANGTCGFNQSGTLSCTGQVRSIVPTNDGAHQVETYAVQSAENWIEDYGSGQLSHGSATVTVDAAFAGTVNTNVEYHVFLTPGGDCKGLYVTHKAPGSFEVHELGGGTASIPFDYKIVAKRTGLESLRLTDVTERMKLETAQVQHRALPQSLQRPRAFPRQQPTPANLAPATRP